MHDLLLALSFIAMLVAPAIVAAQSGKKELDPDSDSLPTGAVRKMKAVSAEPAKRMRKPETITVQKVGFEAATLPMHGTLGMAGR
jgi:hypothetical protein